MDFTVGIVSRNLATMSNFVEFQDSWNFTFFNARGEVRDTWHFISGPISATCPRKKGVKHELKWGP